MAAVERLDEMQQAALEDTTPKEASVMMLIYPKNDIPHFVLIERTQSTGKHSGQIAFPGGRKEETDLDNSVTALRETEEEIGILMEHQQLIMPLSSIYIPPSNYMVYPYLAFAKAELQFTPQISEVKSKSLSRLKEAILESETEKQNSYLYDAMFGNYYDKFGCMIGMLYFLDIYQKSKSSGLSDQYIDGHKNIISKILNFYI